MCNCLGATDSGRDMSDTPCDAGAGSACLPGGVACPPDFQVNVPCSIIKVNGGLTRISAVEIAGYSTGDYVWSTTSTKLSLSSDTGSDVTALAANAVSSGRDAEVITVTRTAPGCSPITKTVTLTVAKLTFCESANQRYGYDNNDTPANTEDNHINIKQSDYTVVRVVIEGGLTGADFNFTPVDPAICTVVAPAASADFDLRLDAGSTNKGSCLLNATATCTAATVFSSINVHVYKERVVDVVVAKIDAPDAAHRFLRFGTADYAAHEATANAKLKQGVVKYNISNFATDNSITPVAFASGTGVLNYDIANGGGADLTAIRNAMTGTGTKVRVAIIRDMKSYYYLSAAAAAGDTTLTITATSNIYLKINDGVANLNTYPLASGATTETITITAMTGGTLTVNAITNAYPVGATIEFPAGGWGSDPILIKEGNASLDVAKWTVLHEVGHRPLGLTLSDIEDQTDFMHYQQSWTDYRLRFCPRTAHYNPPGGTENQWELIPRT